MIKYSKKEITLTTNSGNTYTARKLSPFNLSVEAAKIASIFGTGVMAGADAYTNKDSYSEGLGLTLTSFANMIHTNLEDGHYMDLQNKLFGELSFNGNKIGEDHFEEEDYECDFMEVLWWLFKENIVNFTLSSGMFRSKIEPLMKELSPQLKEHLNILKNEVLGKQS